MKTFEHWRAVGRAMRWARQQDGVTLDVTRLDYPPDGACNLPAGHKTGPELDGFDGHDVVAALGGEA